MHGLLLINLGTPDAPDETAVRTYLDEFLMDRYVIDIPAVFRWLLVKGIILRTRPSKSAAAYQKVWHEGRGSPLLYHSRDLTEEVQKKLAPRYKVVLGMRYGNPSLESALDELVKAGCDEITAFPLYPQYSLAATETAIAKLREHEKKIGLKKPLRFVPAFYDHPAFIRAFEAQISHTLSTHKWDHVLFSYHGLPERHVKKTDLSGGAHCLASANCCDRIVEANKNCYRAQCFATTRELVKKLALKDGQYGISFQSRLGRTPWIRPYTDVVLKELADKGVKNLVVVCPAFVADCLETVEEIALRALADFKNYGGETLKLVPSLNSSPEWVNAVCSIATE